MLLLRAGRLRLLLREASGVAKGGFCYAQYVAGSAQRKRAMEAFIGIRRNRPEFADSEGYIRRLRRDSRLERIHGK